MVVYRQDRRRRVTLVLLVVTSLVLISLDERGSGLVNSARTAAQDVVAPIQNVVDNVVSPVTDFFDNIGRAGRLADENRQLRRQLAQARTDAAAGASARARIRELDQLLDLPQVSDYDGVVASVVARDTGNFSRTFRIDKGSTSGIGKDMPVVVGGALVGRIASASRTSAIVQRLDDRSFGVGVQLIQKKALGPVGIATGRAGSTLLLLRISASSNIAPAAVQKGELAVTTGMPFAGSFPKGLPVGYVARSVTTGGAAPQDSTLRPVVDLDRLDVVKVLRYPPSSSAVP
ncbi:MAG TPA: rod shape-determining protein MreC [Acidimicrobiia bacterium]